MGNKHLATIEVKSRYCCPYCDQCYDTLQQAEECLDSHEIVFELEYKEAYHNSDWVRSTMVFKHYLDAKTNQSRLSKESDTMWRITFKELN